MSIRNEQWLMTDHCVMTTLTRDQWCMDLFIGYMSQLDSAQCHRLMPWWPTVVTLHLLGMVGPSLPAAFITFAYLLVIPLCKLLEPEIVMRLMVRLRCLLAMMNCPWIWTCCLYVCYVQNVTLLELMDEDDVVQECKSQNKKLVDL